jgi:hypothetical protein
MQSSKPKSHTHTHTHTHTHIHIYICTYIHTYMCVRINVYIHTCAYRTHTQGGLYSSRDKADDRGRIALPGWVCVCFVKRDLLTTTKADDRGRIALPGWVCVCFVKRDLLTTTKVDDRGRIALPGWAWFVGLFSTPVGLLRHRPSWLVLCLFCLPSPAVLFLRVCFVSLPGALFFQVHDRFRLVLCLFC